MRKYWLMLVMTAVLLIPSSVFANSYVNQNGVIINETDYENLKKFYSEKHISILSQDEYDEIMNQGIDFDNVKQTIKYIKTEYNQVTGKYVDTEVTEEEYNSYQPNENTRATIIETSYKRIALGFAKMSGTYAFVTFNAIWKIMPKVRSFDVIGVRLSNLDVVNGTQGGNQIYDLNGQTSYVSYAFNGTNIKNLSNGFGISMNLLNSNVTYLECTINATMEVEAYPAVLFASYQHAVQDVTLATSQNYTIGVGLGNVFVFNNNIGNKYDGMEGTYDYLPTPS